MKVKWVLEMQKNTSTNYSYESLLLQAASEGNLVDVKLITGMGISAEISDVWGNTPLHLAARSGYTEIARELIDIGTNVNVRNHMGWTPLVSATIGVNADIVNDLLVAGASVDLKDKNEKTALHARPVTNELSDWEKYKRIVTLLINAGINPNSRDIGGLTPLNQATKNGDLYKAYCLICVGIDVNIEDNSGRAPLFWAIVEGYKEIETLLINSGAYMHSVDQANLFKFNRKLEFGSISTM